MFNRHGKLDIFRGRHKGLAILEFEFKNNSDLLDFEKKCTARSYRCNKY